MKTKLTHTAVAVLTAIALLAMPTASLAVGGTTSSGYPADTPWLCYGGIAGWKLFQYSNCTGKSVRWTGPVPGN